MTAGPASAPALSLADVQRFSRQIALPEIGVAGQARICQSSALVAAPGGAAHPGAAAAAEYLLAAGLRQAKVVSPLASPEEWLQALSPVSVAIRFGLEDDAFLLAAVRLGRPALVLRARAEGVDLLAFRRHGPCPHRELPAGGAPVTAAPPGGSDAAAAVVGATLAASEALLLLAAPEEQGPRARLLRLDLAAGTSTQATLPWTPECFVCGGTQQEASFT